MNKTVNFGADFSLEQTKDACENIQEGAFQLDSISTTTVQENNKSVSMNKAIFHREFPDKILNELTFIEVEAKDPEAIIKEMTAKGHTSISDSDIFIQKKLSRVLVFGRSVEVS
jgi:hypothetical protein